MRLVGPPLVISLLALCACSGGSSGGSPQPSDAGVPDGAAAACIAVDAATACAADAGCDFFLHCGCAAGDKCSVGTSGASCAPAGAQAAGSACAVDADCARGTICVPFFGALQCMQFCDRAHACPSGQECYVTVKDRSDHIAGEVCGPTCKLVDQDCAAAGTGCFISDRHCTVDEGLCLAAGAASQGVACTRQGDCQKGYLCIDPAGPSTPMCAKICDRRDGKPSCDVGTCRDLPGHSQTGICLP